MPSANASPVVRLDRAARARPGTRRVPAIVAAALALAPVEAAAWCLLDPDPASYANYWRTRFPDLRIPVHVATGYHGGFQWTGLTLAQTEAIVQRVIAAHNESVSAPTLYYAGVTDVELDDDGRMRARPAGIVLDSYSCALVQSAPRCSGGQVACTVPGGNADDLVAKARITFEPQQCGANEVAWSLALEEGTDASRVLLHELGHALGLDHTGAEQCGGATDGLGGAGVMTTNLNYWPPYERSWRRDDIAGLRAIYGPQIEHTIAVWQDDAFPAAPPEAARTPLCVAARTPPTLTSSAGPTLLMGFTDIDDRVSLHAWDGARFVAPAGGAVVDPSSHGRSFAPVGVAHDGEVVLMVWSADDSVSARESRLRWARRPLAGGAWDLGYLATPTGETQMSARLAVGHDPGTGQFLVVSIDDRAELYVTAVGADGVQGATTIFSEPPIVAFDVGPPRCFASDGGPRCTISYTDGSSRRHFPYPVLGAKWIEVAIAGDGAATLIATGESDSLVEYGLPDLAAGLDELRGVVGDQRFSLAPGGEAPVVDTERLAADDWPLRIGSHGVDDALTYRLLARRRQPCGDGRVECEEQCDDGNRDDGDGCSATCMHESDAPTTSVTESESADESRTDETGVDEQGASDGCGCATGPRGAGLLVLLGLLARRRPRDFDRRGGAR